MIIVNKSFKQKLRKVAVKLLKPHLSLNERKWFRKMHGGKWNQIVEQTSAGPVFSWIHGMTATEVFEMCRYSTDDLTLVMSEVYTELS